MSQARRKWVARNAGFAWVRVRPSRYEYRRWGLTVATVEKHPHPGSGHFGLWFIVGQYGHFPTLRDAKRYVEAQ